MKLIRKRSNWRASGANNEEIKFRGNTIWRPSGANNKEIQFGAKL